MRFTRFGVTLERLRRNDIELVRQWRNSDLVLPRMRYRKAITPAEQVRWYEALDRARNWYFLASSQDVPFAMFHIKDIDWREARGESGGFIGEPSFIGRPEPATATLALMDFAFLLLQLQSLEAHYNSQQRSVTHFNEQLGYRIIGLEPDGFSHAQVSAERYFKYAAEFRKAALALHGPSAIISDPDPFLSQQSEKFRTLKLADFQLQL